MRPHRRPAGRGRSWRSGGVVLVLGCSLVVGCGKPSRQEVADMYVDVAASDGFDVDPSCVRNALGPMSDSDVRALQEAGLEGSAELSPAGLEVLTEVANQCVDVRQYVVVVVNDLTVDPQLDPDTDLGCVEDQLKQMTSIEEVDRELSSLIIACTKPT